MQVPVNKLNGTVYELGSHIHISGTHSRGRPFFGMTFLPDRQKAGELVAWVKRLSPDNGVVEVVSLAR